MRLRSKFRRDGAAERTDESSAPEEPLEPSMPPLALAKMVRERLESNRQYARDQRHNWRRLAGTTKVVTLVLSASATVVLGIAELDGLATVGFVLSALVTTASGIEPYFNWRSRWVMAEEALATWYRLEEDLVNYVANTEPDELDRTELMKIDSARQAAWQSFSQEWLRERRATEARG